jgi:hypothetical protein
MTRQFLRLLILAKNHLDDTKSREVSDYLDQRFAETLKRINNPIRLDTEKSLMKYYSRLMMTGMLIQPNTSIDVFEDVCLCEDKQLAPLKSSNSQRKLELSSRIMSNSVAFNTSQLSFR